MELPTVSAPVDDPGEGLAVAVVGGGAVGTTVAYDLARRGAAVTLYEADAIGGGATYRSAGICHDAFVDPTDAAVAGEGIDRLRRVSGDDTFAFHECPYVWFARDGDDERVAELEAGIQRMQAEGVIALEVDADALEERFPAMTVEDIATGGIAGAAGYLDPVRYTACLAAAARGAGADLVTETAVSLETDPVRVVTDEEEHAVDAVVVAAGAASGSLLSAAGCPVALQPVAVQAAILEAPPLEAMWQDCTTGCYGRPHPDGVVAGNGTLERVEPDGSLETDPAVTEHIREAVTDRVGAVEGVERSWTGRCVATPDGLPLVGAVTDGVFVASGFEGQGILRAPAVGERLADQVCGGAGIAAYDPTRVDPDEPIPLERSGPP